MKHTFKITTMALGLSLLLYSCSESETEIIEELNTTETAVSSEIAEELNEAQDLNDEIYELNEEVDSFLDSL